MGTLVKSIKYAKKYMWAWVTVILLGLVTTATSMLLPQLPQLIVDMIINPALGAEPVIAEGNIFIGLLSGFASNDYFGMFLQIALVFLVLLVVRYSTHYIRWNLSHMKGVCMEKDMRMDVYRKLMSQNSVVMSRYTSGDLMSITNSDPVVLKDAWAQYFSILTDQFICIILAVFFLLRINWIFMIIPLIVGAASCVLMTKYIKALDARYNEIRESSVNLNTAVQENIAGVRIIRSFATEEIEKKKFKTRNEHFKDMYLKQAKTISRYKVGFMTLSVIVNLGSTILGVVFAVKGIISLGEFTTFLAYVTMLNQAIINISDFLGAVQNALVCGDRMFTFLETNNIIVDPANPKTVVGKRPHLKLNNVWVQLDDAEVLKDVSIDIPYGKKLGIMGKTGSGKSVLIKTLPRFFETSRGETTINGNNVKDYKVEDIREQFSYVMQDVFLFSNTVDTNIAFYNLDAPKDEALKASKVAAADDFIVKLENGYDTIVGERGLGLSGGQKQRISIARALLKNAPILLFDDCTSALDLETERHILRGIDENYADKTMVIASHRATSVMNCDEILFMEDGAIVERGTHEELMALKGKYYDVFSSQEANAKEAIA